MNTSPRRSGTSRTLATLLLLGLSALVAGSLQAATLTVDTFVDENDGAGCVLGDCSFREALAVAADGDTIDFAPALAGGSFTLSLGQLVVDHDVTIDGGMLGLTVRNGSPRLFRVQAGAVATLSGLTLRNAAANPAGDKHGGAVYNAGDLTLVEVTLRGNLTYASPAAGAADGGDGGAIYNAAGATLTLHQVVARQNATGAGGGSGGTGFHAGRGGAVYNAGTLVAIDSTFVDNATGNGLCAQNHGGDGGAIYNAATGIATVTGSTFDRNATGDGNVGCGGTTGTDGKGGALYDAGALALNNSTLGGNQAGGGAAGAAAAGGGLYVGPGGTARLRNVTVAENVAGAAAGGGIYRAGTGASPANLLVKNSLIALNLSSGAGGAGADCGSTGSGALTSEGYNLVGVTDGCGGVFTVNDQTGSAAAPLDPVLGPFAFNGGPTDTYLPAIGSPAVDAANPDPAECDAYDAATGTETPFTVDQRHQPRPTDGDGAGGAVCDVGSAEVPEPVVADLGVTVADGLDVAVPGDPLTYTVVATNAGPDDAIGITVVDLFPPGVLCAWTCSPGGGAVCTPGPVADDIDDTIALPAGGSAAYTAICAIGVDAAGLLSNTATVALPGGLPDPNPGNESATDTVELLVDFGDAPASYGTLYDDDGARHALANGLALGAGVETDLDGQPSAESDADAFDDGVIFLNRIDPGFTADFEVTATGAGRLSVWIDWNEDGDFRDNGEQIVTDLLLAAGPNAVQIAVPAGAKVGYTAARFRLATETGLGPTGPAADGEVEDYYVGVGIFADGMESGNLAGWSGVVN